jgi:hypothetical protein
MTEEKASMTETSAAAKKIEEKRIRDFRIRGCGLALLSMLSIAPLLYLFYIMNKPVIENTEKICIGAGIFFFSTAFGFAISYGDLIRERDNSLTSEHYYDANRKKEQERVRKVREMFREANGIKTDKQPDVTPQLSIQSSK